MAQIDTNQDLPPDYTVDAGTVSENLPPDTLRLAGRFVHSANTRNADAPGIFEINHQIDFLRETDRLVEFSRIDYSIKRRLNESNHLPEIVTNSRHIFNLERPPAILQETFPYYIKPTSRSGLGSIGLKFLKVGKSECKAWLVGRRKASDRTEYYEARELLFDVRRNNQVFDWLDGNGTRIAVEESKSGMYSLNILVSLDRAMRDALAAVWCTRLWYVRAVLFHKKRTWKDSKHLILPYRDLNGGFAYLTSTRETHHANLHMGSAKMRFGANG
ncbi:hypothetical protein Landi51_01860 [Colletotrichum acutatum]